MKRLLLVLIALFTICTLTSCGNDVTFDESKGTLVVGLECNYPPFNWLETKKTDTNYPVENVPGSYAEGYDVQMAKLIAEDLGYELVLQSIVWEGLIEGLKAGTIDLIIAGMSPTEERKISIDFTSAYYSTNHVIVTKADSKFANAKTFAELAGSKTIGQAGTIYDELAGQVVSKTTGASHLNPLDSVPLIINAIKTGVADLTVLEEPVAVGICGADETLTYFRLTEAFDVKEEDKVVSIGVRKADTTLRDKVNAALAKISEETRQELMLNAINNQPSGE